MIIRPNDAVMHIGGGVPQILPISHTIPVPWPKRFRCRSAVRSRGQGFELEELFGTQCRFQDQQTSIRVILHPLRSWGFKEANFERKFVPFDQYDSATMVEHDEDICIQPMFTWKLHCVFLVRSVEYDPLEPNRRAVKAKVGRLCDPCSRVLDKRAEENGMLVDKGKGGGLVQGEVWCSILPVLHEKLACRRLEM